MGRFFTSTQIYNPKQLDCDGFKAYFCERMEKEGYEVCEAECAELSYVLAFADNCKWVTLSSEAYEQGNSTAQADTARIAKMLGTYCVNTTVIDSDCAMLDLYDDKGKKADTAVIGRADDYIGDDIPTPVKAVWEQFISTDSTWDQFMSVVQGDYVFIEDGLAELAPVIGMDSDNILFEYEDESNEKICYLSFRKAGFKKEKKLTLQAGFKSTYKMLLEPKGFSLIKSKYPYFVRVTNDGVVQSVSFVKEKSFGPESEGFSICIGISLISLPLTDYSKSPTTLDNQNWMIPLRDFFHKCSLHLKGFDSMPKKCSVFYKKGNSEEMLEALMKSQRELMPFVLDFFDRYTTLDDMYQLGEEMSFGFYRDVVILKQKVDEHLAEREKKFSEQFQRMVSNAESNPMMRSMLEATKKKAIDSYKSINQWFWDRKIGGSKYEEYTKNVAEMREKNYQILKELEDDCTKKEKKLTLNAAFKQVFGEALEPLGFQIVKGKYPHFVRVVNGEILHVITYTTESSGFRGKKAFQIYGGVATVYRDNLDLLVSSNENKEWLETNNLLYHRVQNKCTESMVNNIDYYLYDENDIDSMISELKRALNITKQIMILYLDTIQNIDTCINHFFKLSGRVYTFSDYFEGLIFLKTDNYIRLIEENIKYHRAIYKKNVELKKKGFTQEEYEKRCQRHELILKRELAPIENILTTPELYTKYKNELERRKKTNIEKLRIYELDI